MKLDHFGRKSISEGNASQTTGDVYIKSQSERRDVSEKREVCCHDNRPPHCVVAAASAGGGGGGAGGAARSRGPSTAQHSTPRIRSRQIFGTVYKKIKKDFRTPNTE